MKKSFYFTALSFVYILTMGCYEPRTGCLDLVATNYDASSDEMCDDCCSYPSLKIGIKHSWEDRVFVMKDTFVNNLGDSFIVVSQNFFLGGIELGNSSGGAIPLISKNTYYWNDGSSKEIATNFELVTGTLSEVTINKFRDESSISYLNFGPGPDESYNGVDTLRLPTGSDLAIAAGMRTKNNSYLCYKAKIIAGQGLKDTLDIAFEGSWRFRKKFDPHLPLSPGKDLKTEIKIAYDLWFKGVAFDGKNPIDIGNVIKDNTPLAFQQ